MKDQMKLGVVAVVMFVAGVSLGATNTPNEYDRACQNFMAEKEAAAASVMLFGKKRLDAKEASAASQRRLRHWLSIMEQFKP